MPAGTQTAVSARPRHGLDLRRAIGNQAMLRLLQRTPLTTELVRDLGRHDPNDWSKGRTGDARPLYAEVAALAKAGRLRDVRGIGKDDINLARNAKRGEKDIKPGLNFVAQLTGKGECGFVDGDGVFRGAELPVSPSGKLPQVAVMLGPKAFQQGKDGALGTLRHEMKHAEHFQLMIDWLEKWRKDVAKSGGTPKYDAWLAQRKGIGKLDHALLMEERGGTHHNTELLAYVEGFINIWHLRQDAPSLRVGFDYPPALYQLRRAGEEYGKANSAVKAAALDRLRDYTKNFLTAKERAHLRTWLAFLADNAREQAKNAPADEASAAKVLHNDFKPLAGFVKELQGLVP